MTAKYARQKPRFSRAALGAIVALAVVAGALACLHFFVMPLKVAVVYFRPALVILNSQPSGADVFVDGVKAPDRTPSVIEVRRDRLSHQFEFRKSGFAPARRDLRFDREVELLVSVSLEAVAPSPVPAP